MNDHQLLNRASQQLEQAARTLEIRGIAEREATDDERSAIARTVLEYRVSARALARLAVAENETAAQAAMRNWNPPAYVPRG